MNSRFLILILALLHSAATWANGTPPIQVQVITFGGTSYFQATEHILNKTPSGHFKTVKTESIQTHPKSSACKDYLTEFQKRPLEVMSKNGYISRETANSLLSYLKKDLDARQFVLITLFSEVTESEAIKLFGPLGPPEERVIKKFLDQNQNIIYRINRGTLLAIRGQLLEKSEGKTAKFTPHKLAWELDDPKSIGLNHPFDRSHIKASIELGRAHAETSILPGNIDLSIHILIHTLSNEFQALKISPSEVLVTGHFLDAAHTRLFSTRYPMRPLTPSTQQALETNPKGHLSHYLEAPLPKGKEGWSKYTNTIVYGSLAQIQTQFPSDEISETTAQLVARSSGRLDAQRAPLFLSNFVSLLREDFDFSFPSYQSKAPLILRDRGTSMMAAKLMYNFESYGLIKGVHDFEKVKEWIEPLFQNPDPDAFSETWIAPFIIGKAELERHHSTQAINVGNIDEQAAQQFPILYYAQLLLAVQDYLKFNIENASPSTYNWILQFMNDDRPGKGLKPVRALTIENFLETYPIALGVHESASYSQLKNLGGEDVIATTLMARFKDEGQMLGIELKQGEGRIFYFKSAQLKAIRDVYSDQQIRADPRNNLNPGVYRERLKLLQAGYH